MSLAYKHNSKHLSPYLTRSFDSCDLFLFRTYLELEIDEVNEKYQDRETDFRHSYKQFDDDAFPMLHVQYTIHKIEQLKGTRMHILTQNVFFF